MYSIQANKSGSRIIAVSDRHLQTIAKYNLFTGLIGSDGTCDETVLDKLRYTVRSLILAQAEAPHAPEDPSDVKPLLDLCMDVLYNPSMKAYGLSELIRVYNEVMAAHLG